MKKYKFEDFIKINSKEIYEEDSVILNDDNKFEELLNQEFKNKPTQKKPIFYTKYWLSAAVITVGVILYSLIFTAKSTDISVNSVEDYLVLVNNRIDSLVEKVEAIDQVEHAMLISDLKQLKKDNIAFIESSKAIKEETIIIDIKTIKDQQMIMLSNLEENIDGIFRDNK